MTSSDKGRLDIGLTAWQQKSNHNRMIDRQTGENKSREANHAPAISYFGSSAFQITSPSGVTIMLDPWRNHPSRKWDWYFGDFPNTSVDIGVSTHAHFDHDALHRLDAHVLLDRLIGTYEFEDVRIEGIADKHATDSSAALYDFKNIILEFDGIDITPPDNPRSWDNCLITVETGGLRILHWGDNRHNPPDEIWEKIESTDVLLIPVDDSQHVLGYESVDSIIERVSPSVVIPHHYYIWDIVQRQSTLQPADNWLEHHRKRVKNTDTCTISLDSLPKSSEDWSILNFVDNVCFDTAAWRQSTR